jgi:hypothetical protein
MMFCRACGRPITGQQRLQSLGRMVKLGLTVAEAKARSPSCFHCARQVGASRTEQPEMKQEVRHAVHR